VIDRRTFIVALLATYGCGQKEEPRKSANASQATPPVTEVQPVGRKARIGFLFFAAFSPGASPNLDALMLGLRELGYTEGRNLLIERRAADGHADRLPELAAELVRSQVELIIIFGPQPLEAARKATKTIPLVMIASSSDPVAEGVALSLARPGGNITGLTYAASSDRFGKQLELLKSAVGQIARVAILWDLDLEIFRRFWAAPLADAGRMLRLEVQEPIRVTDAQGLPDAFVLMKQRRADAILVATGGPLNIAGARVGEIAIQYRLPTIAAFKALPRAGLLMSYGPDLPDIHRRTAGYVDRILKGARPGDLPIELPTKYELVINLKTAKALGLTIPQTLLQRADEVIQ
jgi:putative ABC transport system substrate-binding protein